MSVLDVLSYRIVHAIIHDLRSRKGLMEEWGNLYPEDVSEIEGHLAQLVLNEIVFEIAVQACNALKAM